jgi:O-antigen ligase
LLKEISAYRSATRLLPTAVLLAIALVLSWRERGSILGPHWVVYLAVAGLLIASLLAFGGTVRPTPLGAVAIAALVASAAWAAISIAWTPAPAAARDEALLRILYAIALAIPIVTLRRSQDRVAGAAAVALTVGGLAVATALVLAFGDSPLADFDEGRLYFPITYANAGGALFLLGFWPSVGLAARTQSALWLRSAALAAATASIGTALLAQSKGTALGLIVSTVLFFAIVPLRLRMLVPTLLAIAPIAVTVVPLTDPYRASGADVADAIRTAGLVLLLATAVAAALGVGYAVVDRRTTLSTRAIRLAGVAVSAVVALAVVAAVATFAVRVESPGGYVSQRWNDFTHDTATAGATHFSSLGSQRWNYWTTAAHTFGDHPLAGVGSRGFGVVYAQTGRSTEQPQRAHSLFMDVLAEEGVVGAVLLLATLVPLAILGLRRARRAAGAAALVAAAAGWLAQSAVDWTWTFPALGILFFVVVGIACSADESMPPPRRRARAAAAGAAAIAVVALLPWLSSRFVLHALAHPNGSASDLRWARRLDPLSPTPYVAQWRLAFDSSDKIFALHHAVRKEPRNAALHYVLGLEFEKANATAAARAELATAHRLAPRDRLFAAALARVRR